MKISTQLQLKQTQAHSFLDNSQLQIITMMFCLYALCCSSLQNSSSSLKIVCTVQKLFISQNLVFFMHKFSLCQCAGLNFYRAFAILDTVQVSKHFHQNQTFCVQQGGQFYNIALHIFLRDANEQSFTFFQQFQIYSIILANAIRVDLCTCEWDVISKKNSAFDSS